MDPETYVRELFARYEPTPELDDFREEVLANLHARVAQLTDDGVAPADAARRAQSELGDIDEIAREMSRERIVDVYNHMYLHQRVRPSTRVVAGFVALAIVIALSALAIVVTLLDLSSAYGIARLGVLGWLGITGFSVAVGGTALLGVAHATTTHHPMAIRRALALGAGVTVAVLGALGAALLIVVTSPDGDRAAAPWIACGIILFLLGLGGAIVAGVTGTNRLKPWALREQQRQAELGVDNFSADPALAARFGMYTVALWIVAGIAIAVLAVVGLGAWFWVPIPLAIAVMMLLIARMGFGKAAEK